MRNLEKTNNVVLKGEYEEAVNKPQFLPEYENNHFIEGVIEIERAGHNSISVKVTKILAKDIRSCIN